MSINCDAFATTQVSAWIVQVNKNEDRGNILGWLKPVVKLSLTSEKAVFILNAGEIVAMVPQSLFLKW